MGDLREVFKPLDFVHDIVKMQELGYDLRPVDPYQEFLSGRVLGVTQDSVTIRSDRTGRVYKLTQTDIPQEPWDIEEVEC